MKKINYIVATAVLLVGMAFSVYANEGSLNDISGGAININTATVQELTMLPYIDMQTAQNIVEYRDSHGPFAAIDELLNVKGFTPSLFEELSSHLKLEGPSDYNPYGNL